MSLSPEVIQVLIFLGGALVHFLYSRYATPSSPTPLPGNLLSGVNVADGLQPAEVLRLIQNFMGLMQAQNPPPMQTTPQPADTSAVLADLLHKIIDRQVPLAKPVTPPTLTPNQPAATVSAA